MKTTSQTKNLVILYQKLFNKAIKKLKETQSDKKLSLSKINTRKCSSVRSFQALLILLPQLRQIMTQMIDQGQLLEILLKWKGQYCNMAIVLKYFNRLINMIKNPQSKKFTWTKGKNKGFQSSSHNINQEEQIMNLKDRVFSNYFKQQNQVLTPSTQISRIETIRVLTQVDEKVPSFPLFQKMDDNDQQEELENFLFSEQSYKMKVVVNDQFQEQLKKTSLDDYFSF